MKVNDNVTVKGTKGIVKQIDKDSALITLNIMSDGVSKTIDQWYANEIVEEVVDLHTEAEEVFRELEAKGLSDKEISDLVSQGGDVFKKKVLEFGILPEEDLNV